MDTGVLCSERPETAAKRTSVFQRAGGISTIILLKLIQYDCPRVVELRVNEQS